MIIKDSELSVGTEVLSRQDVIHTSVAVSLESDGSMTIELMGSDKPRLWTRFTFTPSETKQLAKALKGIR